MNAPSSAPLCQPRALLALHVVISGTPTETVTAALLPPYLRFKVHPVPWTIGQTSFRGEHVTNFIFKHKSWNTFSLALWILGWGHVFDKSSRAYFSPTEFQKPFKFYCFCANMVQSVPSFITIGPKLCPGERVSYVNRPTDRHEQANLRVLGVTYEF